MTLTCRFKDTVMARTERDPAFRNALLTEAVDQFLAGELETGKAALHAYRPTIAGLAVAACRKPSTKL